MDYHLLNLKHGTNKKCKISSFLQAPGFDRCFSTRAGIEVNSCITSKVSVKPILDMFSDFHHNQVSYHQTPLMKNVTATSMKSVPSFPSAHTMSVSYVIGGFVGSKSQVGNTSSDVCKLWDVIVNSFERRETQKKETLNTSNSLKNIPKEIQPIKNIVMKRSYADVTKNYLPNHSNTDVTLHVTAQNMTSILNSKIVDSVHYTNYCSDIEKNPVNRCSENMAINGCDSTEDGNQNILVVEEPNTDKLFEESLCKNVQSTCIIAPCISRPRRIYTNSTSSDSSSQIGSRVTRTLSECSVDSDDSYIVFQNEEESIAGDSSSTDNSSDESDEADCDVSQPEKKTKRVSFKPDEDLVKVHKMVTWDYALRAARVGPWERYARDRERFQNRIRQVSQAISPILDPSHRAEVLRDRFLTSD